MKVNYRTMLTVATIALLCGSKTWGQQPGGVVLASASVAAPATDPAAGPPVIPANDPPNANTVDYITDDSDPVRDFDLRLGGWLVRGSGSPSKVTEYESRKSSPFFDADGVFSDAERTIDFTLTGTDNETDDARIYFYSSHLEANVDFQRFEHQLDQGNYAGWNYKGQNNTAGPTVAQGQNLNNIVLFTDDNQSPGKDYAIRVQEFKANFKGNLTDDLKWRVNVFGIYKEGYRQADTVTHCFQAPTAGTNLTSQCHGISQSQHIDWQTTEVQPSLEFRLDRNTDIEYSHTIRTFTQNDQMVFGNWNRTAPFGYAPVNAGNGSAGYDIVPNADTQIDRLKLSTRIGEDNSVYALGYSGYNKDELRDTLRSFSGADLRVTNTSIDTLTLTAHGKFYRDDAQQPTTALNTLYPNLANYYREPDTSLVGPQAGREVHEFGLDGRWRPFKDDTGTLQSKLAIVGGYKYSTEQWQNEGDTLGFVSANANNGPFVVDGVFTQPDSDKNTFTVGVEEQWTAYFNSYVRYRYIRTQYPFYGITPDVGNSIDMALNSALPTEENRVEIGGTWTPTECLMIDATLFVEEAMSNAPYVAFNSHSLPFTVSSWYKASQDWSFSVGVAEMDSWINQDVAVAQIGQNAPGNTGINIPWKYTGEADMFSLGTRYCLNEKTILTGDFEYVKGVNSSYAVLNPANQTPAPAAGAAYDIGQYSLVKMQSYRLSAGIDYLWRPRVTTYVRYSYYDYQDLSTGMTSGTANMVLAGFNAVY